jgi:hypothetical protein
MEVLEAIRAPPEQKVGSSNLPGRTIKSTTYIQFSCRCGCLMSERGWVNGWAVSGVSADKLLNLWCADRCFGIPDLLLAGQPVNVRISRIPRGLDRPSPTALRDLGSNACSQCRRSCRLLALGSGPNEFARLLSLGPGAELCKGPLQPRHLQSHDTAPDRC